MIAIADAVFSRIVQFLDSDTRNASSRSLSPVISVIDSIAPASFPDLLKMGEAIYQIARDAICYHHRSFCRQGISCPLNTSVALTLNFWIWCKNQVNNHRAAIFEKWNGIFMVAHSHEVCAGTQSLLNCPVPGNNTPAGRQQRSPRGYYK